MFRYTRFVLLLFLLLLTACATSQPDPPEPILPNLLVQVTGQVEVRREGSTGFIPVTLGAKVEPGDVLRLVDGEASIFCGNETLWDASPKSLSLDEESGVPCQEGRPPRPAPDLSPLRGGEDSVSGEIPYVLSPRSGFVRSERPTLRWYPLSETDIYTVTLSSDDGQERPPVTSIANELPYPDEWPPLEAGGASYRLQIQADGLRSDDKGGFSLMEQKKAEQVRNQAQRLRQRLSEDDLSLTLLLAELYLNHKLRSEAVELLLKADGGGVVATQRLLGEAYLEMELLDEAEAAYSQALALAEEASLLEEQATAHLHLGLVACAQVDEKKTRTHWQEALTLYQELDRPTEVEEVKTQLSEVEQKCVPPPIATPTAP